MKTERGQEMNYESINEEYEGRKERKNEGRKERMKGGKKKGWKEGRKVGR